MSTSSSSVGQSAAPKFLHPVHSEQEEGELITKLFPQFAKQCDAMKKSIHAPIMKHKWEMCVSLKELNTKKIEQYEAKTRFGGSLWFKKTWTKVLFVAQVILGLVIPFAFMHSPWITLGVGLSLSIILYCWKGYYETTLKREKETADAARKALSNLESQSLSLHPQGVWDLPLESSLFLRNRQQKKQPESTADIARTIARYDLAVPLHLNGRIDAQLSGNSNSFSERGWLEAWKIAKKKGANWKEEAKKAVEASSSNNYVDGLFPKDPKPLESLKQENISYLQKIRSQYELVGSYLSKIESDEKRPPSIDKRLNDLKKDIDELDQNILNFATAWEKCRKNVELFVLVSICRKEGLDTKISSLLEQCKSMHKELVDSRRSTVTFKLDQCAVEIDRVMEEILNLQTTKLNTLKESSGGLSLKEVEDRLDQVEEKKSIRFNSRLVALRQQIDASKTECQQLEITREQITEKQHQTARKNAENCFSEVQSVRNDLENLVYPLAPIKLQRCISDLSELMHLAVGKQEAKVSESGQEKSDKEIKKNLKSLISNLLYLKEIEAKLDQSEEKKSIRFYSQFKALIKYVAPLAKDLKRLSKIEPKKISINDRKKYEEVLTHIDRVLYYRVLYSTKVEFLKRQLAVSPDTSVESTPWFRNRRIRTLIANDAVKQARRSLINGYKAEAVVLPLVAVVCLTANAAFSYFYILSPLFIASSMAFMSLTRHFSSIIHHFYTRKREDDKTTPMMEKHFSALETKPFERMEIAGDCKEALRLKKMTQRIWLEGMEITAARMLAQGNAFQYDLSLPKQCRKKLEEISRKELKWPKLPISQSNASTNNYQESLKKRRDPDLKLGEAPESLRIEEAKHEKFTKIHHNFKSIVDKNKKARVENSGIESKIKQLLKEGKPVEEIYPLVVELRIMQRNERRETWLRSQFGSPEQVEWNVKAFASNIKFLKEEEKRTLSSPEELAV